MSPPRIHKSSVSKKSVDGRSTIVLTLRIDEGLDQILNEISEKKRSTKAAIIREYLDLARYILLDRNSIKSLNENDLIVLKRGNFKEILENFDEVKLIDLGTQLGQFINDLSRLQGKIDDIDYKLDLCENYGYFPKFTDKENYILISKKFGPKRFVEAFIWRLITKGDEGDYDKTFIESEIGRSSKKKKEYEDTIQPIHRDSSHYAFEFAKIRE